MTDSVLKEGGKFSMIGWYRRFCFGAASVTMASLLFSGCAEIPTGGWPVQYSAPAEFVLGPEDVLTVTVWRNQDLSKDIVVRPDGVVTMPLIGDIRAAGISAEALAKRLSERLTEYMSNPIVSVQIKEINSYHIYVLGEVAKPGKYQLKSFATVLQGISLAGGFTAYANRNGTKVIRKAVGLEGKQQIEIPVKYNDVIAGKADPGNFYLNSGDVIVVP